jgi:hypothetical protein
LSAVDRTIWINSLADVHSRKRSSSYHLKPEVYEQAENRTTPCYRRTY